jgi:N-acetylglutamate synthase-like GNAT family acetyltransferase
MTVTIRPATAADAKRIKDLAREVKINTMGLNWERFIVAEDNGEFVGCTQIKPHKDGSKELASVAVVPGRQGQGVGSMLVKAMLERETGTLYLTCLKHNVSFYEQFGFRRIEAAEAPGSFKLIIRADRILTKLGLIDGGAVMKRDANEKQA